MSQALFNVGVVYLGGLLAFAFTTRKTFGPTEGFHWWTPLAVGMLWPAILVFMAHAHWTELRKKP